MNSSSRSTYCRVPLAFAWVHAGARYRVTPWPEVRVERCYGYEWIPYTPSADALAAAANGSGAAWRTYLEFVPVDARELVNYFRANRIVALQVAARCPDIVGALIETPTLAPFVAAQAAALGLGGKWHEVNAMYKRAGVFGLLEWLGLPARRETVSILRNLVTADVAATLLEPLRAMLWAPKGLFHLAQLPVITDRDVVDRSHALAA